MEPIGLSLLEEKFRKSLLLDESSTGPEFLSQIAPNVEPQYGKPLRGKGKARDETSVPETVDPDRRRASDPQLEPSPVFRNDDGPIMAKYPGLYCNGRFPRARLSSISCMASGAGPGIHPGRLAAEE